MHPHACAHASFVLNNARPCAITIISIFKSILSKWTDFCGLWDGGVGGGLHGEWGRGGRKKAYVLKSKGAGFKPSFNVTCVWRRQDQRADESGNSDAKQRGQEKKKEVAKG